GDSGEEQKLIRTLARKGIRFVGTVVESPDAAAGSRRAPIAPPPPSLRQEIHFCTAADGVRIAYAEVGCGPPVVKAANWLNHLEYDWQSPIWSHLLREIAADHRLIRYDARRNGLSDWDAPDISFPAFVRDLESVVAATGLTVRRFARVRGFDRLRREPSRARVASAALWRIRARTAHARRSERDRAGGSSGHTHAPRLGSGEPGVPADLDLAV